MGVDLAPLMKSLDAMNAAIRRFIETLEGLERVLEAIAACDEAISECEARLSDLDRASWGDPCAEDPFEDDPADFWKPVR